MTNNDIETLRKQLLDEADNMPLLNLREDSKAAKVRELYPELLAIKNRSPKVSYTALARILQRIGIDVKADSVRKAMRNMEGNRVAARPASRTAKPTEITRKASAAIAQPTPTLPAAINIQSASNDHAAFRRNPLDPV